MVKKIDFKKLKTNTAISFVALLLLSLITPISAGEIPKERLADEIPILYLPEDGSVHIDEISLFFDWSDVPESTKYKLEISHPTHGVLIFNPIESEYILEGAEWNGLKDGDYTWKVNSIMDDVEGLPSETWTFIKLTTPTDLSPYSGVFYAYRNEILSATWKDTGAEKYKVQIVIPGGNIFEQEVTSPIYEVPPNLWNRLPAGAYMWSVASIVGTHMSYFSMPNLILKVTIPGLLSPFDGTELGLGEQTFDWADVENADSYMARVTLPGNPNVIEFPIFGGSEYIIPALVWDNLPVGEYTWQVKSVKGTDSSEYSEKWHFVKVE